MSLPILDTEQKLREYICKEWMGNYEPHQVSATVFANGTVVISKAKCADFQCSPIISYSRGSLLVETQRIVDKCVIPVLLEAYRKHDEAMNKMKANADKMAEEMKKNMEEATLRLLKQDAKQKEERLNALSPCRKPSLLERIIRKLK